MGFIEKLKALKEQAAETLLEPERVDAWGFHLAECGIQAEVEWRPTLDDVLGRTAGASSLCIGRIRLIDRPIGYIELKKFTSSSETSVTFGTGERSEKKFNYEDHFLIKVPERRLVDPPRAKRRAKRAFWIVGKVIEYQWRGGRFAAQLAANTNLNRVLAESGEKKIIIKYDRSESCIRIVRPYVGMTQHVESGLIRFTAEMSPHYNLPVREALAAYEYIARQAKVYAGLAQS